MSEGICRTAPPTEKHFRKKGERAGTALNGLLCATVFLACVLLAGPWANMPFMDDFSYTKTALDFARTGHFIYNGWAVEILGWLVPWGALFIKTFGFSFNILRLSMLPLAMATLFLFHQILRRFGIDSQNAVLGTLTLALSPLFLPLAASFMTDVPGLLVILTCIYMCQRAVASRSDRAALIWLSSAMLVNVAGGAVRQIAWLGSLVMVPSTAWFLRQRRGMKVGGGLLLLLALLGVLTYMHWFNQQPYSVPEQIVGGPFHRRMLVHLSAQYLKAFLCLLLLVFPVSVALLPTAQTLSSKSRLRLLGAAAVLAVLVLLLYRHQRLDYWLAPWLTPLLAGQWSQLPRTTASISSAVTFWVKIAVSFLVLAPALILAEKLAACNWLTLGSLRKTLSSRNEIVWILGPFTLSYVLLLAPRGIFAYLQDRYVLGLLPVAVIVLLRLYPELVVKKIAALSLSVLILAAFASVGATHDYYSESRAIVAAIRMARTAGIPRKSILAGLTRMGWAIDGWAQIEGGGNINDSRIETPKGAYNRNAPELKAQTEFTSWFGKATPAIIPNYVVVSTPMPGFARTGFPPIHYRAWLPPFDRALYVEQLKNISK